MRVLILQDNFTEIGLIKALKKEGHYVISIGIYENLPGEKYVDEYHKIDYSDTEAVMAFMKEKKMDTVCACCNDTAVLTACYIAEKMSLSGYDTLQSARIIAHKDLFKQYTMENNIKSVESISFKSQSEANKYLESKIEYPQIIKPIDLSGGKGISRCNNYKEAKHAIKKAFTYSREKSIVVEPFIVGTQHAFCTFIRNRKVVAYCSNDEFSVINPYRVEIATFPASNIKKYCDVLIEQVETMAEDLALVDGIFHIQYIESEGDVYIIEAMRRVLGNMYGIPAEKSSGFKWDYWQAMAWIGEKIPEDLQSVEDEKCYAYRAIIPKENGIFEGIYVDESIRKYIFKIEMIERLGTIIENNNTATVAIVFMEFDTQQEMRNITVDKYDLLYAVMKRE